jgi:hypothetical protein
MRAHAGVFRKTPANMAIVMRRKENETLITMSMTSYIRLSIILFIVNANNIGPCQDNTVAK